MAMKNMRQTTLSFASATKHSNGHLKDGQDLTPVTSSLKGTKTQKAKKSSERHTKMDVYVEIPPALRGPRTTPSARASSVKSNSTRMAAYGLPRKTSVKRKLSPEPKVDQSRETVPRIVVDPASSQPVPVDTSSGNEDKPSKKPRLSSSSPLSALTPLPPSDAPSSVHGTDTDDVEFVPTSQSDELELTLPGVAERDPMDVQESIDSWRKKTMVEPPSRADSPCASDRFCSPLSDIPMDVDYGMFLPPLTIPDTHVAEGPASSSGIPYPRTPLSANGEGLEVPSNITMTASDAAWITSTSRADMSSQRNPERKGSAPDVSPSDAFRSLTPPPSSSDTELETMQDDVPAVKPMDVKSKTDQLIADIKARALAAARSSPEQTRVALEDLSDSDSESSGDDEDGLVALMKDTKGKRRIADTPSKAGPCKSSPMATPRYNLRRPSPKVKPVTPATQVRKSRKTDPFAALLREKHREERDGTGMAAVRFAEATIARSRASLHDEMEDEEDEFSSDSDTEYVRRTVKGNGRSSSPGAPPRTQKAKRKDEDGSDEDEDITGLDCEAILGKEGGEAVGKILASDIKEKMAEALAKLREDPLGMPFWARRNAGEQDHEDEMDAEAPLPPFKAEVGGNALRQMLKTVGEHNDKAQLSALLVTGFVSFLQAEQYPVVVPWLFDIAFSDVGSSLSTLAYTQLLRLGPLVGSQTSGLRLSHLLVALIRLGASLIVFQRHEWTNLVNGTSPSVRASNEQWRDEMVYRLMTIVSIFAQSFARDELIDTLLALILVGMDPATSDALQTLVRKTSDIVVEAMTPWQEFATCTKIVPFAKTLTPPNQALLVSFIPSICPGTVRMARCIARAVLLDDTPSALEYENGLPDLTPFVDLLAPAPGTGGPFNVQGNTDKEGFYDALTCRVTLLAHVLSDIDEYTLHALDETHRRTEARKNGHFEEDNEADKNNDMQEPKLTVLEQIKRNLDVLHGKIVDTRAAHLDRSRAKAALQRLAFRVHYQRVATMKSGRGVARPRNLLGYFHGGSS